MANEILSFQFSDNPYTNRYHGSQLANLNEQKREYLHSPRKDVIAMLDTSPNFKPQIILDIGCNTGATGYALKQIYPEANVIGVEPDAPSAEHAKKVLDHVEVKLSGNVDWQALGVLPETVDLILLPDVLEHMYNPWHELLLLKKLLKPNTGKMIASIPNSRFLPVLHTLASGDFPYCSSGSLDATHIRFFTFKTAQALFTDLGFQIKQLRPTLMPFSSGMKLNNGNSLFDIHTSKIILPNQNQQQRLELSSLQLLIEACVLKTTLSVKTIKIG